jgi:hypothetical protein
VIYFDAMSRKEQIEQYRRALIPRDQKIVDEELRKKLEPYKALLSMLGAKESLQEIRDDIWETGEIVEVENLKDSSIALVLQRQWPAFYPFVPDHAEGGDDNHDPTYYPAIPARVEPREVYIKISAQPYSTLEAIVRVDASRFFGTQMHTFLSGSIRSSTISQIDEALTKACMETSNGDPIAVLIERDRQTIINKVLSGELKRSSVPQDFAHNFPPNS